MELKVNTKRVKMNELKSNPWNPKLKPEDDFDVKQQYDEVVNSVKTYGLVDPILVRSSREGKELGYYEIINGYHRFLACRELKFKEIIVNDLGDVTDNEAKKLTIVTEEVKIPVDQIKLSHLLKEMLKSEELDKLVEGLPYSKELVESKIELLEFDWDKLNTQVPGEGGEMSEPSEAPEGMEDNVLNLHFDNAKDKVLVESFFDLLIKEEKKPDAITALLSFIKSYKKEEIDEDEEEGKFHKQ